MEKTVKLALDTVDHVPQNRSMNTRNVTLGAAVLIIAGLVIILVKSWPWCEPDNVRYVVEWNEAKLKSPEKASLEAFKIALGDNKVRFRHNIVVSLSGTSNDAPELKNFGLSSLCIIDPSKPSPKPGLHVTQRVGFDNLNNLVAAEALLEP